MAEREDVVLNFKEQHLDEMMQKVISLEKSLNAALGKAGVGSAADFNTRLRAVNQTLSGTIAMLRMASTAQNAFNRVSSGGGGGRAAGQRAGGAGVNMAAAQQARQQAARSRLWNQRITAFGRGIERTSFQMGRLASGFSVFILAMNAWSAAIGVRALAAFAKLGQEGIATETIFKNVAGTLGMSAEQMLPKLTAALGGTISKLEAMRAINHMVASGAKLSAEQYIKLAEAAKRFSLITGEAPADVLNKITGAVATGTAGGLGQYGIKPESEKGDTVAEKRISLFNAVVDRSIEAGKLLVGVNEEQALSIGRLGAMWKDFGKSLSDIFISSGAATAYAEGLAKILGELESMGASGKLAKTFNQVVDVMLGVVRAGPQVAEVILNLIQKAVDMAGSIENAISALVAFKFATMAASVTAPISGAVGTAIGGGVLGGAVAGLGPLAAAGLAGWGVYELISNAISKSSVEDSIAKGFDRIGENINNRINAELGPA
jgi:hypothetical protein